MLEAPLFAFLGALVLNLVATPWLIRVLRHQAVFDIPNARSSHDEPVPRGGGIFVVTTWCLGMTSTWALRYVPIPELGILAPDGFVLSATFGMAALAVLGFLDDRRSLDPFLKLTVQVLVAAQALWLSGLRLSDWGLPLGIAHDPGTWGWVVSLLWLVGFMNIFNFMDGINGLAFMQLIFGGTTFCLLGVASDDYELAISGALAAGSAVGILKYNFPRALVFMGDVGSLPAGYLLALMALRTSFGELHGGVSFLTPVLVLWPFLYDGSYTLINRLVHGRNPFRPHRSHLYQRLIIVGMNHKTITLYYAAAMALCSGAGYLSLFHGRGFLAAMLLVALAVGIIYTIGVVTKVRASMTEASSHGSSVAPTDSPPPGDGGTVTRNSS
jgi:UDP-N-acetylmuramyl pentapeptide phosphotransferase/UDP-N-acetylglucosamine-1-phosphate transferase